MDEHTEAEVRPDLETRQIKLHGEDLYTLTKLRLEAAVKQRALELARIEAEAAQKLSEMAGDLTTRRLGVPEDAAGVTLDLNSGVITYKVPATE